MCFGDKGDKVEDGELGSVEGGTKDRRRNSKRFLWFSLWESTLEGLEREMGSKVLTGLWVFVVVVV
jgi:hypothetical protein